jgi:hypothetical protein
MSGTVIINRYLNLSDGHCNDIEIINMWHGWIERNEEKTADSL